MLQDGFKKKAKTKPFEVKEKHMHTFFAFILFYRISKKIKASRLNIGQLNEICKLNTFPYTL